MKDLKLIRLLRFSEIMASVYLNCTRFADRKISFVTCYVYWGMCPEG